MLEFRSGQDVTRWLENESRQTALVIGVRTAIRVAPLLVASLRTDGGIEKAAQEVVLPTFRALATSWFAGAHPKHRMKLRSAYRAAMNAADAAAHTASPAAAAYAADAAFRAIRTSNAEDAASAATEAGNAIAAAVASAGYSAVEKNLDDKSAFEAVFGAISRDVNSLRTNMSSVDDPNAAVALSLSRLWPNNAPDWAIAAWNQLEQLLLPTDPNWKVWITWYHDRFTGNAADEASTIPLVVLDKETWREDFSKVNAAIKKSAETGSAFDALNNPERESVEPQSDEPTLDDRLSRRPFAQALVERMDNINEKGGADGFAVHIHGPWGAGKTSILMMMRQLMITAGRTTADGKLAPRWVTVNFNAWEHERRNPPWWPLVEAIKTECVGHLSDSNVGWLRVCRAWAKALWRVGDRTEDQDADKAAILQGRWIAWKLKTDAFPYLLAIAVGALFLWLLWSVGSESPGNVSSAVEWSLKFFTVSLTVYVAFYGASRIAIFGSTASADFYEDISQDPLKRIQKLFLSIVEKTNKPICIFIDDLDRCRTEFVVDLLEGIQTSFRCKGVTYVVAADRAWIKAAFETRYSDFSGSVGSVGQPLGYLFLEKIFQVSTPMPGMGDEIRSEYWTGLLQGTSRGKEPSRQRSARDSQSSPEKLDRFDRVVESKRAVLRREHDSFTREQAEAALMVSDTAADRAAVMLELNTSRAAEIEAEHLLARFIDSIPENPRFMKRMVNAFAVRQAIGILERSQVPTEVLARWTVLEQRFPSLADLLIDHPQWIETLAEEIGEEQQQKLPQHILPFANFALLQSIIGVGSEHPLTLEAVRAITRGSVS